MIERLSGIVLAKQGDRVVLGVGGIGFQVEVSAMTLRDVPAEGEETRLFAHLHVREDAMQLFGFSTEEERTLFKLLVSVSKIGPKIALAALSCRRAPDLKKALAMGDVALLASVPGIGKKTAERIILELREKMGEMAATASMVGGTVVPAGDDAKTLAREALVELGYSVLEADRLLAPLSADQSAEDLVREALSKRG